MKKIIVLSILFSSIQMGFSQIEKGVHTLNSIDNLLTEDVKHVLKKNIDNKQTVFLGEAVHYSGTDFLAKTEFVKYLVKEHGFKDIAFEADFFALLFDHDKRNLYSMWSRSVQCKELFEFLKQNDVTIWGFDVKSYSKYSYQNFTIMLSNFLEENEVELNQEFIKLSKLLIKHQYESRKELAKSEVEFLKEYVGELQILQTVKTDPIWNQVLNNFHRMIELYTIKDNSSDTKRTVIRDKQMADNLDYLVKRYPDKKFIVWLANGHMSKSGERLMKGQTMGFQFNQKNPNTSYHIAIASIKLPERKEKDLQKARKKKSHILSLLPSLDKNYLLDVKELTSENLEIKNRLFDDQYIFNLPTNKSKFLNHFDAFVFISNGEEVRYD